MEAKQTMMGTVEFSTVGIFTYHQGENVSNNDYSIMFNTSVKSIKVHGRKRGITLALLKFIQQRLQWI